MSRWPRSRRGCAACRAAGDRSCNRPSDRLVVPHRPLRDAADAAASHSPDDVAPPVIWNNPLAPAVPSAQPQDRASGIRRSTVDSAFQKIVVRYADGKILKGYTQDFHPRPARSSPSGHRSTPRPKSASSCRVSRLKAVFFVRDFDGNPELSGAEGLCGECSGPARRGHVCRRRERARHDAQLSTRRGRGFSSAPQDPDANNTRIYVVAKAVRRVRFL